MSEEGASYKEQILDAARRNNSDLFEEILKQAGTGITHIINGSRDPLGNTPLHLAAKYGSYEVLDEILDQEGVEVDPVNRIDGDTPLHLAVRYAEEEPEHGAFIAETLIEAGADARIKNSNGLKPIQLVRSNASLTELLLGAELAFQLEQEERERGDEEIEDDEGSGSDSGSE